MESAQVTHVLQRAAPFATLDPPVLERLAGRMTTVRVPFGDTVFREGDPSDALYVVARGKARVVGRDRGGHEVSLGLLDVGDHFGEIGLMEGVTRTATIRAADDLTLLRMAREDFERLLAEREEIRDALRRHIKRVEVRNFLKRFSVLGPAPARVIEDLARELEEVGVHAGCAVIRQGDVGDRFYIVRKGTLDVIHANGGGDRLLGQLTEGEFFGEWSLVTGGTRAATVVARSECELYALPKAGFERALEHVPDFRAQIRNQIARYRDPMQVDEALECELVPDREKPEEPPPPPEVRPSRWRRWLRRYPFVDQHDETDCAAACLAMLTRYHGVPVGLSRLRDLANVDADGASMWSLAQAAESLGFHARGLHASFDALSQIPLPAVAHWEGSHYVVIYEVRRKFVLIGDPAVSLRKLSHEEFQAGWTGRLLELTPTPRLRQTEPTPGAVGRYLPILRPHLFLLGEVMLASLILSALGLGLPFFMQTLLDRVLVHRSVDLLALLLVGMAAIAVFRGIIEALRQFLLVHLSNHIDVRLIFGFLRHVWRLPMKFFDLRRTGDIVSRVTENAKIRSFLSGAVPSLVLDSFLAVGYIALMAYYSLSFAGVVLAILPFYALLMLVFTPLIRRNRAELFARSTDVQSFLIESLGGRATVKAMAVEPLVRWKMESLYLKSTKSDRRGETLELSYSALARFVEAMGTILLLAYGAQQVMKGALSIGQLLAFVTMASAVVGPILSLVRTWQELQDVRNAVHRLNDVLDSPPEEPEGNQRLRLRSFEGGVALEKVEFQYSPGEERPVLAGITVEIRPGETVALVGRSGSGKTTLAKLLQGLYLPTRGRVLLDGHDLRTLSLPQLRRHVGVVPQEVFLFSGTIRENIELKDPDGSLEEVIRAAQEAGAHDFISQMPLGYETKIGELGASLSGGQRQRIALARALFGSPKLLILDEATSNLDNESERSIQKNLEAASRGRTTIVIAHRLSTVRHADRILVLDGGIVVEEGSHEQLLARGGLYANLVGQQLDV